MTTEEKIDKILDGLTALNNRMRSMELQLEVLNNAFLTHRDRIACLETRDTTPVPARYER